MIEQLVTYGFHRVDFVYEPGQFSIRGGILDIFSYSNEYPYRIELSDIVIESIRTFDTQSQLSIKNIGEFKIIPNVNSDFEHVDKCNLAELLLDDTLVFIQDLFICMINLRSVLKKLKNMQQRWCIMMMKKKCHHPRKSFCLSRRTRNKSREVHQNILSIYSWRFNRSFRNKSWHTTTAEHSQEFQIVDRTYSRIECKKYQVFICTNTAQQIERFYRIFEDLQAEIEFTSVLISMREGFIDDEMKLACFTDHQIFLAITPQKQRRSIREIRHLP